MVGGRLSGRTSGRPIASCGSPRTAARWSAELDLSAIDGGWSKSDPDAVLNGIAFDAARGRVYLTGKLWPNVFEIEVPRTLKHALPRRVISLARAQQAVGQRMNLERGRGEAQASRADAPFPLRASPSLSSSSPSRSRARS